MQSLIIEATEKTPFVCLDYHQREFLIQGKSIPTDAEYFYLPLMDWFDEYVRNPKQCTELKVDLDLFNISSSKRILFILYKLNDLVDRGLSVSVKWCYREGNEDMLEVGQDYAFMVKIPFEFVQKKTQEPISVLV
jgi:hypothetical protein